MKRIIKNISILAVLMLTFQQQQAQMLDVSVVNAGANKIQFIGTATAPGFDTDPGNAWGPMNITWRIPKSATVPAPTVTPPAITPEVTAEATAFTGAEPRDLVNAGLDLTMFDLTFFGMPDDGYWYFQVTGTMENVQNISTGGTVLLYEFSLPAGWVCPSCVEILLTDLGLPIGTASFIDNGGLGRNVLNLVTNMAPLPVRFISFEAARSGDDVKLAWKVAEEVNVSGYHVERSADGRIWNTISFVPFNPAPTAEKLYTLIDRDPLGTINYYRIRQQDLDGRVKYSDVRFVRFNSENMEVRLYPVPVTSVLKLNIQSPANIAAVIRVTNMLGNTVHQSRTQLVKGGQTEDLNLVLLPAGTYYIEIRGGEYRWSGKFIKK
ncbi:T9SS type A sorting domain-containing protein [Pseudobacter ginsenosidimutans]|uniref:Putative secreted protein (Por secretion system target) n=1 Tax=Pseudobacter ginsenosidimutans TaxID=661488 RepID=A0A4Q7N0N1_9BACT|nr:T9SS type A sorting domain-containing protein [Pseudobacter ginsenosidimutans]QEC43349.1 T9SS type A sorting domain-containing protein [Pseudobacter ginsenosidimutans]RZS74712.1 putative secreted protein (Por secretion system target) [Pseudobacter ginsenosidimutans]